MCERFPVERRGLTLDEARSLAFADLRRRDFPSQAAFEKATEARAHLLHALGEALQPDPPMRVVLEALRRAEDYRELLAARAERRPEPVELTPSEAAAWLERERPSRPKAGAPPGRVLPSDESVTEAPHEQTLDEDLAYEIGYRIGTAVERLAKGFCGLWRRRA